MRALALASLVLTGLCGGALFGCAAAPQKLQARMDDAEAQARKAELALDAADRAMEALEPDKASLLLTEARERLADPNITKYPEHSILRERLKKTEARLPEVREARRQREIERAVAAQKDLLAPAEAKLEQAVAALQREDAGKPQLDEVRAVRDDLRAKLDAQISLESQQADYKAYAAALRKRLDSASAEQRRTEKAIAFREGPGVARKEALELIENAKVEKAPAKSKVVMIEALGKLRVCRDTGNNMLSETPDLAKAKIVLPDGKATTADAVTAGCAKLASSLEKKVGASSKKAESKPAKPVKAAKAKKKAKVKKGARTGDRAE